MRYKILILLLFLLASTCLHAQQGSNGIDPEAIIERILAVDKQKKESVHDLIFDVESIEGEIKKDGHFEEKERFDKKIYIKFQGDSTFYYEEYLAYYKDNEKKSDKDLQKQAKERKEKKKKRKARNISFPVLRPFYPEFRDDYEIQYNGISTNEIENHTCHNFRVTSKVEDDDHINGDFYFEANSFHLVRVDFTPAKLIKKMMFKLKELKMSIIYSEIESEHWLPTRFDLSGKGKAAFFFGVKFAAKEYFKNPVINSGFDISKFEEKNDD